ncbi:MAG: DUF4253 domain-containing protein [Oscillospiraceae bacterium]|nr:DUF4253 domain-containing protein [Oscillospiraceae bacterium]
MSLFDMFKKSKAPENHSGNALQKQLAQFPYPCEILPAGLTREALTQLWLKACDEGRREGFTPILLTEPDQLEDFLEEIGNGSDFVAKTLAASEKINVRTFFGHQMENLTDGDDEYDPFEELGEMENGTRADHFISYDAAEQDTVILVKVPTTRPWETVIYLPFGGWNECPYPEEIAAVLHDWHEKYGAVPALMTHDILEVYVPSPIPTEQAMEAAKEQYLFCCDIVEQGVGTIGALADCLRQSKMWYFWWD